MTTIKTEISNHNKAQINKPDPTNDNNHCNCRNSSMCIMDGKCNDQNMIYQPKSRHQPKERHTLVNIFVKIQKCSSENERYKHATELSKHVWGLKDKNTLYNIKRRRVKQARSYSNVICVYGRNILLSIPASPKCQH